MVLTGIVSLRCEHKIIRKPRIPIKSPNTLYNIPAIEFELLVSDLEFLAFERGPAWQFTVDDVIEFVDHMKQ